MEANETAWDSPLLPANIGKPIAIAMDDGKGNQGGRAPRNGIDRQALAWRSDAASVTYKGAEQ